MTAFVDLVDSVAVITGAGSGIGRAVAHALARQKAQVVVTDIDEERADGVAGEIRSEGGDAVAMRCDVSQLADFERVRDICLERFGRVDVVMNNVSVLAVGSPVAIPLEEWQRAVDINLLGIVRSNQVFLPVLMEQQRGHVVNTASTAGLLPYGYDRLPYTATKHAIVGLSESLALYLRPRGVGVSCLCPAGVITNIAEHIRYFGTTTSVRAPALPVVEASVVGHLVVEAIVEDRFLVLTTPEVGDEIAERAQDIDGYVRSNSRGAE
ncbi:MAG TPA: SDR family NAD(P)-dependent oxidoreductase [Acidimicrobiales bacterium]|jgi:NAD(P)-dependent dehydrogenase (short-subunit alcohol dehydrogenase family)|nr:SDR family NAD(P)-dependent oxidoreductase [Acidimicrobiales bacterium]